MTRKLPRLLRVADRRNALYLEDAEPELFAAIDAELAEGATVDDVVSVIAETATPNFVKLVRSAARHLMSGQGQRA